MVRSARGRIVVCVGEGGEGGGKESNESTLNQQFSCLLFA